MMALGGPSFTELLMLLMMLGGFGLPLGVPPQPENPVMQQVAPAKCLVYSTWAGMATPDANSTNQTEQLFAEPELQAFAKSLEASIGKLINQATAGQNDPRAQQLAQIAPLWTKTIITRPAAVFATKIAMNQQQLVLEGGLIVDAGESAPELAAGLVELLSTEEARPEIVTLGKSKFHRFPAPKDGPAEGVITIGTAGPYLLMGIGPDTIEGMIERIRAKQVPAWLTALQTRLPVERRASMSYVNTKVLVDAFLPLAGPEGARMATALGLSQIGEVISVTGLDKQGMVTRSLVKLEGEPRGLLTLLDGRGIEPKQLAFIPKDATFATAFTFSPQQMLSVYESLLDEVIPNGKASFQEATGQFEQVFGLRLQEDVLASLGEVWTVSMTPLDSWLGTTATVEIRDRAKIATLLANIEKMLADAPVERMPPRIESSEFGEHTIQMLAMPGLPLRPAWCLTADRLIVAPSPQAIKAHLSAKANEVGLFNQPALAGAFAGEGRLLSVSYQDTAKLFESSYSMVSMLAPFMMESINDTNRRRGLPPAPQPFDFSALPSARSIHRHLLPGVTFTRRMPDGVETESHQTIPMPNIGASAPVAVALLLPAVQAARSAARRMQSSNNLKQLTLAMHNYASVHGDFPPAYTVDKEGKPLLSWRVLVLPYIEEQNLYDQFKLDEPWDSEHNKKLIDKMPQVLKSPQGIVGPGMTQYLGIAGEKGVMGAPRTVNGKVRGTGFAQILDGTSNTVIVVETNNPGAVTWTKPDDYIPDPKNPSKNLLGLYPGGFNAAFADGSVQFLSEAIEPQMLMNLFQMNDGNAVRR